MIPGRKVHVFSQACMMNSAGAELFRSYFLRHGWEVAERIEEADLVIHFTCAQTREREDEAIRTIEQFNLRLRPAARLVLSGCLPKINPERMSEVFRGDVIDPRSYRELSRLAGGDAALETPVGGALHYADGEAFVVVTSTGCLHDCSFCAIKTAVGRTRSRPAGEILSAIQEGLRSGYREIRLISDDNASYGLDIGTDLVGLLTEILRLPGDFRIAVWQINPWGVIRMLPGLAEAASTGRLSALRSHVQSGNDEVLRSMRRPYRISAFKDAIRRLRRAHPDLLFSTAVIVGFPGESEEAFQDTLRLLLELNFDDVRAYPFSERPTTTIPAELPRISDPVLRDRMRRIEQVIRLASPDILRALQAAGA